MQLIPLGLPPYGGLEVRGMGRWEVQGYGALQEVDGVRKVELCKCVMNYFPYPVVASSMHVKGCKARASTKLINTLFTLYLALPFGPYPALLTPRRGVTLGVLVAWSINYVDNASYPLPLRGMGYKDARKGVLS